MFSSLRLMGRKSLEAKHYHRYFRVCFFYLALSTYHLYLLSYHKLPIIKLHPELKMPATALYALLGLMAVQFKLASYNCGIKSCLDAVLFINVLGFLAFW